MRIRAFAYPGYLVGSFSITSMTDHTI